MLFILSLENAKVSFLIFFLIVGCEHQFFHK